MQGLNEMAIRTIFHILLHFAVPGLVARYGFRRHWKTAWLVMVATMLVDLDHLLADPIFDPTRCGIGFHPLHSYPAISVYALAIVVSRLRLVAIGLLIHMALDGLDCQWITWETKGWW